MNPVSAAHKHTSPPSQTDDTEIETLRKAQTSAIFWFLQCAHLLELQSLHHAIRVICPKSQQPAPEDITKISSYLHTLDGPELTTTYQTLYEFFPQDMGKHVQNVMNAQAPANAQQRPATVKGGRPPSTTAPTRKEAIDSDSDAEYEAIEAIRKFVSRRTEASTAMERQIYTQTTSKVDF